MYTRPSRPQYEEWKHESFMSRSLITPTTGAMAPLEFEEPCVLPASGDGLHPPEMWRSLSRAEALQRRVEIEMSTYETTPWRGRDYATLHFCFAFQG